jgi:hypothetical protein
MDEQEQGLIDIAWKHYRGIEDILTQGYHPYSYGDIRTLASKVYHIGKLQQEFFTKLNRYEEDDNKRKSNT